MATLVYHWKDPRLYLAFCQFFQFVSQTMMIEFQPKIQWPGSLSKKDYNLIIQLRFLREMEKRYNRKVQVLDKTLGFGSIKYNQPKDLARALLESIVS